MCPLNQSIQVVLEKRPLNGTSSCSSNINITIITINIIIHEIGEYDAVDMIKLFLYVIKRDIDSVSTGWAKKVTF